MPANYWPFHHTCQLLFSSQLHEKHTAGWS